MSEAAQAIFANWSPPPWLTLSLALTAILYLRGWLEIGKTRPQQFDLLRLASFYSGLAILWLAIASPMDGFADVLLSAHMIEHLLLMSVVPPLLLYGQPVVPLLRGLPLVLRRGIVGPLIRLTWLRRFLHWLTTPVVAWFAMNMSFLAWHVPSAYDFALEQEGWHAVEHICFLGTSILFWWCIMRPWPAETKRRNWGILLYLVSADVVNTMLSAFLSFCERPVYSFYLTHPNPFQVEPLEDQVLGAVIMWVLGSLAFLLPAMFLAFHLVRGGGARTKSVERTTYRV